MKNMIDALSSVLTLVGNDIQSQGVFPGIANDKKRC